MGGEERQRKLPLDDGRSSLLASAGEKDSGAGSLKRRSPDEVRVVRASGNEIIFGEEIVMGDNSTAASSVIPFRSAKLLLVERDGQPFIPMKPVVEGMGLDWKSQHAKLQGGRFNSVMVMITTTGADGKQYEMACLPLRKLAGWLMSIHASKVRPELRDGVIDYQNECDEALWSYWNEGRAVNHREKSQSMTLLGQTIGTDGFHMLGAIVKGKVAALPVPIQRRATAKIWSQVHAAFGVRSAADIPAEHLDGARNFIAAYAVVEGEFVPRREQVQIVGGPQKRYLVAFKHKGEQTIEEIPHDAYVLSQHELMEGMVATPGDIPVSVPDMFNFLMAAVVNLKSRYEYMTRRAGK
ncbi:phage antirepressor N-terminal domain-containing protein [Pseudomonas sp.]|uniref:phage antirepressor N-terminal domain-containing protein n=1 Tax=Pseudomonas sp. TaxID=306 RepID=UPI00289A1614|nr:phage antirepressor N-terminal domain-containing protein [Pseudomonas sp.]